MEKKFQICFPKCLKSAAKLRRANQTAPAILTAPTVYIAIARMNVVVYIIITRMNVVDNLNSV